ncbi:MAG: Ig-like domain-containing protein, partial [Alphaproteobacteria bacterium]|nr:Ig-like domain-containing protein [Alphaproteobacteria bacterium]
MVTNNNVKHEASAQSDDASQQTTSAHAKEGKVVYAPFDAASSEKIPPIDARKAALKALLEKHVQRTKPDENSTDEQHAFDVASTRELGLNAQLPQPIAATSDFENSHSKTLDLTHIVQGFKGDVRVDIDLSNPRAGIVSGQVADTMEISHDGTRGNFILRGSVEDIRQFLAEMQFTPTANEIANFHFDIEVFGTAGAQTSQRVMMFYENDSGFFVPMRHGSSAGTAQYTELDPLDSPLRPLEVGDGYEYALAPVAASMSAGLSEAETGVQSNTPIGVMLSDTRDDLLVLPPFVGIAPPDNSPDESPDIEMPVTPMPEIANIAPKASHDSFVSTAGNSIAFNLTTADKRGILDNDSDADGDAIQLLSIGSIGTAGGRITPTGAGKYIYTSPNASYAGIDVFNYTIHDGHGNAATATITFSLIAQGVLELTASLTDDLHGGNSAREYYGVAANWHTGDTIDGAGAENTLAITAGLVNVNTAAYTNIHSVETWRLEGDLAHSLIIEDSYFTRTALASNQLTIEANANTVGMTVDASAVLIGHDVLIESGSGDDNFSGGAGDDSFSLAWTVADTVVGGTGEDTLVMQAGAFSATLSGVATLASIETFDLTEADAAHNITLQDGYYTNNGGLESAVVAFDASGLTNAVTISALELSTANAVHFAGGGGGDTVNSGAGADSLVGGAGADEFFALAGADTMNGAGGDDILQGGAGNDSILGGAGDDALYGNVDVASFDPTSLSDAVLWLDASDAASITSAGGLVSAWNDKSGAGNHQTQVNAADQPDTGVNTINGLNVITNARGERMFSATNSSFATSEISVFAVVSTSHFNGALLSYAVPGTDNEFLLYGNQVFINGSPAVIAGATYRDGTPHMVSVFWQSSDGALQAFTDGNSIGTATILAGFPLTNNGTISISGEQDFEGAGFNDSQDFDGLLAETLVFAKNVSLSIRAQVELYLSEKWGRPSPHADDDVLKGEAGNDSLFGGLGDDTLVGGTDVDTLNGGAGDD